MIATVSEVLTRAAALLDKGVSRGANARLPGGKACGVFDQRAVAYSMYGALCAVLGPGLADENVLRGSPAWKLISLRAWESLPEEGRSRMEYALHDLNDWPLPVGDGRTFRDWAADPEIKAMGEWR